MKTQGQFPEMRKKIEKRGRKLVDFDGERHALQAMQSNPRRAETKLAKQRESLESAKRTYDVSYFLLPFFLSNHKNVAYFYYWIIIYNK